MRTTDRVLQRLRDLCLSLPETSEVGSWGHPNFRAGKRTFAAFERIDGRPSIAFRLNTTDVGLLLRRKQFFVTPYGRGQWVSVWADAPLNWRFVAHSTQLSRCGAQTHDFCSRQNVTEVVNGKGWLSTTWSRRAPEQLARDSFGEVSESPRICRRFRRSVLPCRQGFANSCR